MMNGLNGGPYGQCLSWLNGILKTDCVVQINRVGVDGVADIHSSTCECLQTKHWRIRAC